MKTKLITQSAVISALYIALCWIFAPISFGAIQVRISEILTILPIYTPSAIPGLFIGCALSNLVLGGGNIIDLIFGSIATLIAAILTYKLRNKSRIISLFPPVIVNALIVGTYLNYIISPEISLFANIGWVFLGQFISCYCIGLPLCAAIDKYGKNLFK